MYSKTRVRIFPRHDSQKVVVLPFFYSSRKGLVQTQIAARSLPMESKRKDLALASINTRRSLRFLEIARSVADKILHFGKIFVRF